MYVRTRMPESSVSRSRKSFLMRHLACRPRSSTARLSLRKPKMARGVQHRRSSTPTMIAASAPPLRPADATGATGGGELGGGREGGKGEGGGPGGDDGGGDGGGGDGGGVGGGFGWK